MTRLLIFNFKGKSKNFWNVSPYLWPNWNTSPSPGAWSKLFTENKFSPPQERTLGQPVQCWSIAKNSSFLNHSRPWLEYGLSSPIHGWLQLPLGRVSELGSVFRGLKEKVLETHSERFFFWGGGDVWNNLYCSLGYVCIFCFLLLLLTVELNLSWVLREVIGRV